MGYYLGIVVVLGLVLLVESGEAKQNITSNKCDIPPSAPKRIEEAINSCQDEIKIAILSEALSALNANDHHPKNRAKRATFSNDEKRIAGCLLQCVYRKMKAMKMDSQPLKVW
ncbi:unnamed protein product [Acanthoscelides obtectus]|uniref:Uncharacterized protein n=1 Tax=Acanthoscelides obtectus TaxID=200917 RepID=A0A9P0MDT6_ACAOB|nr:unnamed protein product [Acanthoscelides obtectus]CAK1664497.1 General odorant-binding protein 70 [Acanthoscelides obtectus]